MPLEDDDSSPSPSAAATGQFVVRGVMDQYEAINEADRRWGRSHQRGIALQEGDEYQVGLNDDRLRRRVIFGKGPCYEDAFRDADRNGHKPNGDFASKPSKNPLWRDI